MRRALLLRLSSLGDVVLTSALIEPLKEAGYEVYLFTYAPYGRLFYRDPRVKAVETTRKTLFTDFKSLPPFELKLDLQKSLKSYLLRLLAPGRWRSYPKESLRRRLALYFPRLRKPYSVVEAYGKALEGLVELKRPLRPKVELPQEDAERYRRRFGPYAVIAPGARYEKKRYRRFRRVAELLKKEGLMPVWVGSAEERPLAEGAEGVNLCGELPLEELPAVVKGAEVFLGNDSGLTHLARAVGTPAVQVYGATHPTLGFALGPDEGKVLVKNLPCQPCSLHGKGGCRHGLACLDFEPEELAAAALSLVSGGRAQSPGKS
ncbi:MAG: glycosyltransferase family 9 protein [Aquificae bacterium]|nr:glycosyltransferase family 9 protein [Aquificota bacterium]